ncbi:MAG: tRNA sulfurtransferase [Candidatus Nanohaloarchaea archaeon]
MRYVLVRYSDIGTKSRPVRKRMRHVLRQRVQDRLRYEEMEPEKVSSQPGRIIVEFEDAPEASSTIAELPGVASTSPAFRVDAELEAMKDAAERFEYGDTFGVDANRAGEHSFDSQQVKEQLGAHVQEMTGAEVDLDRPETLLEVDIRNEDAYLFTQRFEGPGGLPVGTQDQLAALISGGIDSPVAAFEVMKRGADILPVYFYNKPVAAEDHLLRFESSVQKLARFHPGKDWDYYRVDMEEVNRELMKVGRGRMVLHRIVMFRAAARIAEKEGLPGIVTGEALGQKSSQTLSNLDLTSSQAGKTIHRPLFSWNKEEITRKAREIGTYEDAKIASACSTMAPDNPATRLSEKDFEELVAKIDIGSLVEKAVASAEKCSLDHRKG